MLEVHIALIAAVMAVVIALRRQSRLPSHRLEWPELLAERIYTNDLLILSQDSETKRQQQLKAFIDPEGRVTLEFPREYDPDGENYQASMCFERGRGGFRIGFGLDFLGHRDVIPPHRFLTLAFSAGSPEVSIFDGDDTLIAKLP